MKTRRDWRIGVLGHGAIGSRVATEIAAGQVAGAVLAGVIVRTSLLGPGITKLSLAEALRECDLIVECAGQQALAEQGQQILESGVDLLVTSMGALADPEIGSSLGATGPGRLFFTSGAIGGLDLLAAGARRGEYQQVQITTRKLPATLTQPWMGSDQVQQLTQTTTAQEIFCGPSREAARYFPKSLNVAAAVALAINDWDKVTVRLIADPAASLTEHHIQASGASGEYSFTIKNKPDPANPRTSGVVPYAVLRSLEAIIGRRGGLI